MSKDESNSYSKIEESNKRYLNSEKGKQAKRRYNLSDKGKEEANDKMCEV